MVHENGLTQVLKDLVEGPTSLRADEEGSGGDEYRTKMKTLRILRLARFEGDDYANARGTDLAERVLKSVVQG